MRVCSRLVCGVVLLGAASACGGDEATPGGASGTGGVAGGGGEGGAPVELPPLPSIEGVPPLEDLSPEPTVVEVELFAREHEVALEPGAPTTLLNYNDQLPGPLIQARVGDRVIIHFTNELAEPTTIHWHGLRISDQMDGSPMIQAPVEPGASFTYDFIVPDAGTFWYHTHLHQIEQFEKGLYGALVVHEAALPAFSAERIFVGDDIRLDTDNQVSPFLTSGPDIGAGRVGNTLLVNGQVAPFRFSMPRGAVERWRFVLATNSLAAGLRVQGADARVISTDGGLLPQPFDLDRVEIAPGQRYDFEVRPHADAAEVVLEALVLALQNGEVVEVPLELGVGTIEGEVAAGDPIYPEVTLPPADVAAEQQAWVLGGANVGGKVEFTIDGQSGFVDGDHVLLHTFEPNVPVRITLDSDVSPAHPFHVHGQFFQIVERGGQPVTDEPGLRDTVHVRGAEKVTILSYFENPGRWMVHCHISEHSENGMMADIQVGAPGQHAH